MSAATLTVSPSFWREGLSRTLKRPLHWVSLGALILLLGLALAAPIIAQYSPIEMIRGVELRPPSLDHWIGTDEFGRDLFSRMIYGLRLSFFIGGVSTLIGGALGVALGLIAGYRGGVIETIIMRTVDGLLAFPPILQGIALVAVLGPGVINVMTTLVIVQIPVFARLARGMTLAEKQKEYVTAAVAVGASPLRVSLNHILLNSLTPLFVQFALAMGFSVLIEASLSFLGLGIKPPEPSLGSILDASRNKMRQALWYPFFPGAALTLLLFALNGVADMLNDVLNPRHQ